MMICWRLKIKTIAYMALHYGRPYIQYAIRSVIDVVDELHILYTDKPSHGSVTDMLCPDTEIDLHELAWQAAGSKLHWHKGDWYYEHEQRNSIAQYAPDVDVALVLDSDEVWRPETLQFLYDNMNYRGAYITVPMFHFYHNFRHAMIHDLAAPPRILFPKAPFRDQHLSAGLDEAIAHFGYCQPVRYLRYKLAIHGHKQELRFTPDEYIAMYQDRTRWTDLHPVGHQWTRAVEVFPLDFMPEFMCEHPYFDMRWVE